MWTRAARLAASCTFMQILHLATRLLSVHLHVLNRVVSNLISTQAHEPISRMLPEACRPPAGAIIVNGLRHYRHLMHLLHVTNSWLVQAYCACHVLRVAVAVTSRRSS